MKGQARGHWHTFIPANKGCLDNSWHAQPAVLSPVDRDRLGAFLAAIEKEDCWIKVSLGFGLNHTIFHFRFLLGRSRSSSAIIMLPHPFHNHL